MKLQKLYSYTRQAINDFSMIQDGDKIAIGVSGGKDSLTLLYALSGLQKFISEKIELVAITVDLGFGNFEIESVKDEKVAYWSYISFNGTNGWIFGTEDEVVFVGRFPHCLRALPHTYHTI